MVQAALLSCAAVSEVSALAISGDLRKMIKPYKRGEPLQDIVTWDEVGSLNGCVLGGLELTINATALPLRAWRTDHDLFWRIPPVPSAST